MNRLPILYLVIASSLFPATFPPQFAFDIAIILKSIFQGLHTIFKQEFTAVCFSPTPESRILSRLHHPLIPNTIYEHLAYIFNIPFFTHTSFVPLKINSAPWTVLNVTLSCTITIILIGGHRWNTS
jgi:hypothetical protein